jgi:soluble lytic murein transglycosylase-like protein
MELNVALPMTTAAYYPTSQAGMVRQRIVEIRQQYSRLIEQSSELTRVPAGLIAGLIFVESNGRASAVSSAGAVGLMQLKPQSANDAIFLENRMERLTDAERAIIVRYLGARAEGIFRMKYLGHKLPQNNQTGNVVTKEDLVKPEFNILVGSMLLGLLIDQHTEGSVLRLDKAVVRYNQGYFYKPPGDTIAQTLDSARLRSAEAYNYILKMVGKNGALEVQL